ncbi:hypothetical protein MNV49_004688 [Pseudohyphozyma bogoriensis]|nr:hypothetical protein MNV49_004688 [Pseudohyphozyma bogoriensis]
MVPIPPPDLPPNPSKVASPPLIHLHPSYLFELRDRLPDAKCTVFTILRQQVKKVIQDPAVHSVTFSKKVGPGGPHAFLSYAPHFHPNKLALDRYLRAHPGAPQDEWEDRIPWDRIDGNRNPDTGGATQGAELSAVCSKVVLLALTYHFALKFLPNEADQYCAKAHQLLWTFFGDPATAMLPEVEYGQVRPLIELSQILPLLPPPPSPYSPHAFMHPWLARHVAFLQHHQVGKMAASRKNNIQTHYYIQLCTHLVTLNRAHEAHSTVAALFYPSPDHTKGLSSKIDANGVLVEEVKRPNPFHYTCFELEPLTFLADLASNVRKYNGGANLVDVWEAENHALRRALDFGLEYWLRGPKGVKDSLPKSVPKEVEKGSDIRSLVFQTRVVALQYGRGSYEWIVGRGTAGEMEPPKAGAGEGARPLPLAGWNVAGRLKWAMLEGY